MSGLRLLGIVCFLSLVFGRVSPGARGVSDKLLREQIDALAAEAYQTASEKFPCKIKTRGKPKMMRWEQVDRCLNEGAARVDWAELARRVRELAPGRSRDRVQMLRTMVEASLTARALRYEQVLTLKKEDVLLPLTHSVLKYLPADSLMDTAVLDKQGTEIGTFWGVYNSEHTGGLFSGNTYDLSNFQYLDLEGKPRTPSASQLERDRYGVLWERARAQPGYRLILNEWEEK